MTTIARPTTATGASSRRAGFERHDLIGEPATLEQVRHAAHGPVDVVEEHPVSGAQIVQAGFAVRRLAKAVARAFAITGEQHLAVPAIFRQRIELVAAELALSGRGHELEQRRLADIAEQVVGLHVMVAGVKIAIMFDRQRVTASRRKNAGAGLPDPVGEGGVEGLYKDLSDIAPNPFVKDLDQEVAILIRPHRTFRDKPALLDVERTFAARAIAPSQIGLIDGLFRRPLDDRNELQIFCLQLVAEEPVNLRTMITICPKDGAENIDVNLVPHEAVPRTHDPIEGAAPALCHAVGVVHALRTIDAQADQETMRLEEARPFVVEKYPVGLDRVHDPDQRDTSQR